MATQDGPVPATRTLYHLNTRLFVHGPVSLLAIVADGTETASNVTNLRAGELAVALDETIFHPTGGGQDSDFGIIELELPKSEDTATGHGDKRFVFRVREAKMAKGAGTVFHSGNFVELAASVLEVDHPEDSESIEHPSLSAARSAAVLAASEDLLAAWSKPNAVFRLRISAPERIRNARLHTAGHLVDLAMLDIGLMARAAEDVGFRSGKASHVVGNAWVEYSGAPSEAWEAQNGATAPAVEPGPKGKKGKGAAQESPLVSVVPPLLDASLHKLLPELKETSISALTVPYAEAAKLCGGWLPDYLPADSEPRIVILADGWPGCPCGGTHLRSVGELWDAESGRSQVKVTGVRHKKGVLKVLYEVE
ncbi:hypothetical protein DFJ74DRAFT_687698 [Hyaloraphidium curvatum]|nr:hypothetical protein DFJ74DRAFT_687698 [Hyaloraphidium curvatum]